MNTSRDNLSAIAPTVDERAGLATLRDGMSRSTRRRRIARSAISAACAIALVGAFVAVRRSQHDSNVRTHTADTTSDPAPPISTVPVTFIGASSTTVASTTVASTTVASTSIVRDPGVRCPAPRLVLPRWDQAAYDTFHNSQDELQSDFEAAQRYLTSIEDGFDVQYDLVLPARLTVQVSGHAEEVRAALSKLLSHPDRFDVVLLSFTKADVKRVSDELYAEARANIDVFNEFSEPVKAEPVPAVLSIGLNPGQEARAASYVQRWGPIVQITIAGQPYLPKGCGPQSSAPTCPDVAAGDPAAVKLELSLTLAKSNFNVSEVGRATLRVQNNGTEVFDGSGGPDLIGVLVEPGTRRVVARFTGGTKAIAIGRQIAPGESADISVIFGAARCDGGEGSALPPGVYGLRVVVGGDQRTPGSGYLSPEIPVTLTAG
jgi:hypothetical protein